MALCLVFTIGENSWNSTFYNKLKVFVELEKYKGV